MTVPSRPSLRRPALLLPCALLAAALLGGCAAADSAESAAAPGAGETSYPLTLDTEFGSTTLQAAPERVVALGDLDDTLALGVVPVGSFRPAGDVTELMDYQQTALETAQSEGAPTELEQLMDPYAEPDYEAIAALEPDVILAAGYWDLGTSYERLSDIAPVVALPEDAEDTWENRHRVIATALDRGERGEEAIEHVHSELADAREANPEFSDLTLNYAVVYPTQVTYMSVPDTEASWFFTQLGFQPGPEHGQFSGEYPGDVVSEEKTSLLDADVLVIGYHSLLEPGQREAFEDSSLFTALTAVQDGGYLALPEGHDSSIPQPGVLSTPNDLEAVLPGLVDTVANREG